MDERNFLGAVISEVQIKSTDACKTYAYRPANIITVTLALYFEAYKTI